MFSVTMESLKILSCIQKSVKSQIPCHSGPRVQHSRVRCGGSDKAEEMERGINDREEQQQQVLWAIPKDTCVDNIFCFWFLT